MEKITYTHLRQNLSSILDHIEQDRVVYNVQRKNHEDMVILTQADFSSLLETLYLLSSTKNAQNLTKSFDQAKHGEFTDVDWQS